MANTQELMKTLKKTFLAIFPELSGYHFPIRAKVVKVHETGGRVDEFNHRYSVDVQPFKPDGTIDESAPEIPDIEIPVMWAGTDRGVFSLPEVGSVVRIGFYYNDPAHPFLDAVLGYGYNCPDHPLGSFIIQHSNGKRIEITKEGKAKITMDLDISGNLNVGGSVNAAGSVIDGGGNTNHHSH